MDEQTKEQLDGIESMFVQTAQRAGSDGERLTQLRRQAWGRTSSR